MTFQMDFANSIFSYLIDFLNLIKTSNRTTVYSKLIGCFEKMYEKWQGFNSAERVKSNGMEPPIASLPASCWTPRSHTLSRPRAIPRNLSQRCGVQVVDFLGGMGSMMFNACLFSGIQFDGPSFSRDWFLEKSSQHLKKELVVFPPSPLC